MRPPSSFRFQQTANWILLVALVLAGLLLQARWVTQLDCNGETSDDESDSLIALARYTAGQPLYLDYRQPPHVLTQYMPLLYIIPGTVARWMHCDKPGTFVVGRSYVYVCWLGVGWLIYLLARQAGAARFPSALAATLWFAVEIARTHGVSFRPDGPQLFFSLAAIGVYLRGDRWPNLAGATALLVIAFLHKQSAVAPVLALGAFGWCNSRRASVLAAAVAWTAAIGVVVLFMRWWTGDFFALNCFHSLGLVGSLARVIWVWKAAAARGLPGLLGGVFGCFNRTGSDPARRVWRWYFVVAFGLALTSSWKFGSESNYYLEPFAAGCVLTAVWLTVDTTQHAWQWLVWLALAAAVTFNSLAESITQRAQWSGALLAPRATRAQEQREWDERLRCLGLTGEPVLIEDPYLAIRQSDAPYLLNGAFLNALQRAAQFDDTDLMRNIKSTRFTAVVTVLPVEEQQHWRHFSRRWLAAVQQHYRLVRTCCSNDGSCWYVYLPALADFPNVPLDIDFGPHSP